MKRCLFLLFLILPQISLSIAQEESSAGTFDAAWSKYVSVKQTGKPREVVIAAKEALDIAEQSFSQNDERLPLLMSHYGMALLNVRQREAAIYVLERSVELAEETYGADSKKMIPLLANYADSRAEVRNSSVQVRYYKRALGLAREHHGRDSVEYALLAFRAGMRILELSKTQSGKKYLRDAREIYSAALGDDSYQTGLVTFYLGKTDMAARGYKTATDYFLDALRVFIASDDQEHELFTRAFLVKAYEFRGMPDEATAHCLAIGARIMISPDQDYQPLFRMAPVYPPDMLRKRQEGFVDIRFTVDEEGFVKNPQVINQSGGKPFEQAALDAVLRFRYAPRFESGKPVAIDGVKARINFKITRK